MNCHEDIITEIIGIYNIYPEKKKDCSVYMVNANAKPLVYLIILN